MQRNGGLQRARRGQVPADISDPRIRSKRHVRLHYRPEIVLPYFPHVTGTKRATDKKFVDAIAPPRQPVFTAIKRVHANIRHPPCAFHGGKLGKIFAPVRGAYVVTRDVHRGERQGEGELDLVACRANWPRSFLIRSIYRTHAVYFVLSLSLSFSLFLFFFVLTCSRIPLLRPFIRRMQQCSK